MVSDDSVMSCVIVEEMANKIFSSAKERMVEILKLEEEDVCREVQGVIDQYQLEFDDTTDFEPRNLHNWYYSATESFPDRRFIMLTVSDPFMELALFRTLIEEKLL